MLRFVLRFVLWLMLLHLVRLLDLGCRMREIAHVRAFARKTLLSAFRAHRDIRCHGLGASADFFEGLKCLPSGWSSMLTFSSSMAEALESGAMRRLVRDERQV